MCAGHHRGSVPRMNKNGLCFVAAFFLILGSTGCGGESNDAVAKIEGDYVASTRNFTVVKDTGQILLTVFRNRFDNTRKEVSLSLKEGDDGVYVGSGGVLVGQVTATFSKDTALVVYGGSSFRGQRVTLSEGKSSLSKNESVKALTTSINGEVKATWDDDLGRNNNDKKIDGRQHFHVSELLAIASVSVDSLKKSEGKIFDRYKLTGQLVFPPHERSVNGVRKCTKRAKGLFATRCKKFKEVDLVSRTIEKKIPFTSFVDVPRFSIAELKTVIMWEKLGSDSIHIEPGFGGAGMGLVMQWKLNRFAKKTLSYSEIEVTVPEPSSN